MEAERALLETELVPGSLFVVPISLFNFAGGVEACMGLKNIFTAYNLWAPHVACFEQWGDAALLEGAVFLQELL